jgi:hypothetical protein
MGTAEAAPEKIPEKAFALIMIVRILNLRWNACRRGSGRSFFCVKGREMDPTAAEARPSGRKSQRGREAYGRPIGGVGDPRRTTNTGPVHSTPTRGTAGRGRTGLEWVPFPGRGASP